MANGSQLDTAWLYRRRRRLPAHRVLDEQLFTGDLDAADRRVWSGWFFGPASTATSWSPTDKTSTVTLSNSNLTAVGNTGFTVGLGRAADAFPTGLSYFEAQIDNYALSDSWIVGGVESTALTSDGFGGGTRRWGVMITSTGALIVYNDGVTVATLATTAPKGGIVGIAYDSTNKKFWGRLNNGLWNASGTDNPATNTGGSSTSLQTGTIFPAYSLLTTSDRVSTRFSDQSWVFPQPSGAVQIATSSTLSGTWTASGVAAGTLVGASIRAGTWTASGLAAGTLAGTGVTPSTWSAAGVATQSLVGAAILTGTWSAAGAATQSLVGAAIGTGTWSASGAASDALAGASTAAGTWSAAGAAADALIGGTAGGGTVDGTLTAAGVGTATFAGASTAAGTLTAAGAATPALAGAATAAGAWSAAGAATDALIGASTGVAVATWSAAGTSVVSFVGADAAERAPFGMLWPADSPPRRKREGDRVQEAIETFDDEIVALLMVA